jgi:putative Mg2+ transporter-C (MgtC) family protein
VRGKSRIILEPRRDERRAADRWALGPPGGGRSLNVPDLFEPFHLELTYHLLAAVVAGGLIGLERSYHGRPAGFRTHALVCLASSLLMQLTIYQAAWFPTFNGETVRLDPTRMAQGVMTGIGFLGAGVIFKEGLSVRGLTTAASIWITAAIGILAGAGFYFAVVLSTALALFTLSLFRHIEMRMPTQQFTGHSVRFAREAVMDEAELRRLLAAHGFRITLLSYRLDGDTDEFEYRMMLMTKDAANLRRLAETLMSLPSVRQFRLSPTGD